MENQTITAVETKSTNKLGAKNWIVIWVAGLAGQLCWNIENQWFNTFVYAKIAPNPSIITWMVAVSAIVSTLSTFISGTGSDRMGKRKPFIVTGYILWGVFTIAFGLTEFLPLRNVVAMATMVIVADAVMSFFGSLGNDAGFNPWTTDITNKNNRGGLGAVIAVQPVIATIVGSLGGGFIIEAFDYIWFFVIMGVFVIGVGIFSAFAVKDSKDLKPSRDPRGYFHQFGQAFNFKLLAKNKLLLIVLCIFAMFFVSFNVYFPHILNFFIYSYGYDTGMAGVLLGAGLIAAIPLTLLASKFINKQKFVPVASVAVAFNIVGLVIMSFSQFASGNKTALTAVLILAIFFVGGGYMVFYQALMIWCKNLYPEEQRGQLEGVRLFFYVCIPMVLGPAIANPVINNLGKPVTLLYDDVPIDGFAPSIELIYISAAVALLTFVPIYIAYRYQKNHPKELEVADSEVIEEK